MPSIFISDQEAAEIIEALEYAKGWLEYDIMQHYANSALHEAAVDRMKRHYRLLVDIKRRVKK